jgi:hypothetical protein
MSSNEGVNHTPEQPEADLTGRSPEDPQAQAYYAENGTQHHVRHRSFLAKLHQRRMFARAVKIRATDASPEVKAPRRTSGSSGRPRAGATRSSARSGDSPDGDDPPAAPRPRGDGAARLLRTLARSGLHPDALKRAAALVVVLDEAAAADRSGVA